MTILARPHDARGAEESDRLARVPWRTGASLGRSVYAIFGEGGHEQARDDEAVLIGTFDAAVLAAEAVEAHNARLAPP